MQGAHTIPSATITRRSGFLAWVDEHSLVLLIIACSMAAVVWELFDLFLQPQYPIADCTSC